MRKILSLAASVFVALVPAVVAAFAPQEQTASTPPAVPPTIKTVRNSPGMSSAHAYRINKTCFAGWSAFSEVFRNSGEHQKQSLLMEAAEAALQRGIAAGAVAGISADQVRAEYEAQSLITKADEKRASADVLLCSLVYPAPGQPDL
jgi:hypothetical protein